MLEIKNVTINKREALFDYRDVYRTRLHEGSTVHQHHHLRKKLREITKLDWGELSITLPKQLKIEPQVRGRPEKLTARNLLEFCRSRSLQHRISLELLRLHTRILSLRECTSKLLSE
jgi:hypothetical protein